MINFFNQLELNNPLRTIFAFYIKGVHSLGLHGWFPKGYLSIKIGDVSQYAYNICLLHLLYYAILWKSLMFKIWSTLGIDLSKFINAKDVVLFNKCDIEYYSILEVMIIIFISFITIITSKIYLLYKIDDVYRGEILTGGRPWKQARTRCYWDDRDEFQNLLCDKSY